MAASRINQGPGNPILTVGGDVTAPFVIRRAEAKYSAEAPALGINVMEADFQFDLEDSPAARLSVKTVTCPRIPRMSTFRSE